MVEAPAGTLIGCWQASCSDRPLVWTQGVAGKTIELNRVAVTLPHPGIYATSWLVLHGKIIGAYLDDEEPDQQGKILKLRGAGYRGDILAGVFWHQVAGTPKLHHAINALEYYPQMFAEHPRDVPPPAGWGAYIILWTSLRVSPESREEALRLVLAHRPKYVLLY